MTTEVNARDALMRLGASAAEAVAQTLDALAPGAAERGEVSVLPEGARPFANVPAGAIASSVSYVNGATGANIFVLAPAGARVLAGAMGVSAPQEGDAVAEAGEAASEDAEAIPEDGEAAARARTEAGEAGLELSELELSAVAEAANQTMAAASSAISVLIGQEIQISPPETRVLASAAAAEEAYGRSRHAISTTFTIDGHSCRLVQLVPEAFVIRVARAIDDRSMEAAARSEGLGSDGQDSGVPATLGLEDALSGVKLLVWAELGRTVLPLGRALELPVGAVVELDRAADAPVDLFVNGLRFAQGHLFVGDDGEWAIAIDELGGLSPAVSQADPLPAAEAEGEGAAV